MILRIKIAAGHSIAGTYDRTHSVHISKHNLLILQVQTALFNI